MPATPSTRKTRNSTAIGLFGVVALGVAAGLLAADAVAGPATGSDIAGSAPATHTSPPDSAVPPGSAPAPSTPRSVPSSAAPSSSTVAPATSTAGPSTTVAPVETTEPQPTTSITEPSALTEPAPETTVAPATTAPPPPETTVPAMRAAPDGLHVVIPKIGLDRPVMLGGQPEIDAGHVVAAQWIDYMASLGKTTIWPNSCLPGDGCPIWLVGHRTTHGSVHNRIPELVAGDNVHMYRDRTLYTYTIELCEIVPLRSKAGVIWGDIVIQASWPDNQIMLCHGWQTAVGGALPT